MVPNDKARAVVLYVPWGREAPLCHHVLRVNSRGRINSAPSGMTSINANSKKEVMEAKIMRC